MSTGIGNKVFIKQKVPRGGAGGPPHSRPHTSCEEIFARRKNTGRATRQGHDLWTSKDY